MTHFNSRTASCQLSKTRILFLCSVVLSILLAAPRRVDAVIFTAGELLVDLKVDDLVSDSTTWINQAVGPNNVGDFIDADGTNLNLGFDIGGVPVSLAIVDVDANAVISEFNTPSTVQGNGKRSVEAWLYSEDNTGSQGVVSWGAAGADDSMSRFSYNTGGNGLLSAWFNDTGWSNSADLLTNEWVHVAWTYDGNITRGYINGELKTEVSQPGFLTTAASPITVGARPGAGNDGLKGYIADVRVHTGVLNDAQVLANFEEGIGPADGLGCDFDGDADCDSLDFQALRDNLFTAGGVAQGDYDRSGFVDLADYRAYKDDPNTVLGVTPLEGVSSHATVPEPTSMACLGTCFALLTIGAVRRQRHIRV